MLPSVLISRAVPTGTADRVGTARSQASRRLRRLVYARAFAQCEGGSIL